MMSTASGYLTVAGLAVDVVYKDIKNLHISVYPPAGRVRIAAPEEMGEEVIRLAVVQRLPWIKRQQKQLLSAERQSRREMLSGETHYVWGARYRLDVSRTSGNYSVAIEGKDLVVVTPDSADADARRAALNRWYSREIKAVMPSLLETWQEVVGVEADRIVVRRMKTKWGTCKQDSRTIWINPELAKKPPRCLEYILVHELTHLHERTHNERFVALMDEFMPDWRARRDELNRAPLAEEDWALGN